MGRDRTRLLRISFATIEGKQLCRVDVSRSSRPVFVNDTQNVERLYVRAGNSTRELTVSEVLLYCREHFVTGPELDERPSEVSTPPSALRQADLIKPGTIETRAAPNLDTHGLFRKRKAIEAGDTEARRRLADQYEIDDVIAIIRDVVSGSDPMDREEVIRQIGRQMGAERVGSRTRDLIESGLNAASRRSITYTDHRGLRALCRTIDDYKRDDLKNVLRSVVGRTWTDDLGFRRTGSRIEQAFRSAIRGGLRQGTLERNGSLIRAT
jgi:hypothetical protein